MKKALAMIETKGFVTAMEAADAAMKAADVELLGWKKVGSGMVAVFFTGDVASAKAAVEAGSEAAGAASGIMNAADPIAMIDEMIAATRRAANDLKKER